jgi:hypothetical protein
MANSGRDKMLIKTFFASTAAVTALRLSLAQRKRRTLSWARKASNLGPAD